MQCRLGHTAYKRKSPNSSVFLRDRHSHVWGSDDAVDDDNIDKSDDYKNIDMSDDYENIDNSDDYNRAKQSQVLVRRLHLSALFQQPSPWANTGYH